MKSQAMPIPARAAGTGLALIVSTSVSRESFIRSPVFVAMSSTRPMVAARMLRFAPSIASFTSAFTPSRASESPFLILASASFIPSRRIDFASTSSSFTRAFASASCSLTTWRTLSSTCWSPSSTRPRTSVGPSFLSSAATVPDMSARVRSIPSTRRVVSEVGSSSEFCFSLFVIVLVLSPRRRRPRASSGFVAGRDRGSAASRAPSRGRHCRPR